MHVPLVANVLELFLDGMCFFGTRTDALNYVKRFGELYLELVYCLTLLIKDVTILSMFLIFCKSISAAADAYVYVVTAYIHIYYNRIHVHFRRMRL